MPYFAFEIINGLCLNPILRMPFLAKSINQGLYFISNLPIFVLTTKLACHLMRVAHMVYY